MIHIVCTHDRVQINVRTMHVFHFDSSSSIFTVSLLRFPHDRTFQRLIVFYFATSFQRGIPLGILLSLNFTREFSKDNSKTIVEQTKEGYIYIYVRRNPFFLQRGNEENQFHIVHLTKI